MATVRGVLKQLRNNNNLTCQQVADGAGITKEYYWQLENGKRNLSYELAVRISAVFNMNPDEIFLVEELTNIKPTTA